MALHIVRYEAANEIHWGLLEGNTIAPINVPCTTTQAFLELERNEIKSAINKAVTAISPEAVKLLSPITAPSKVLCQGMNYRQHIIDSGQNPDEKRFNIFFTKSTASVTGPEGKIIKPHHVTLLDYEIELVLVIGKHTDGAVSVQKSNLHEYVAGICIGNDVSARDVQLPQGQFHKGKSYRTFCPMGPVLCLLDSHEMKYLNDLQLTLTVNGQARQIDSTANMIFNPAETLSELSQIHDFEPGDVVMTGTPSGCAARAPSPVMVRIASLLPEAKKWDLFIKSQQKCDQYLKIGDRMESTIISGDGEINLGKQSHIIAGEL